MGKIGNDNLALGNGPGKAGENDSNLGPRHAPKGWKIPTKADFEELIKASGNTVDE
jgi:hypothetical protein